MIDKEEEINEYSDSSKEWSDAEYALNYLEIADQIPYKKDGEMVLLDHIPKTVKRVLDLGTGDGRLINLLSTNISSLQEVVGLDISPTMLNMARDYFKNDNSVKIITHDLSYPLPKDLGQFDAIVSGFAIHHLTHERKRVLYKEIFDMMKPGGIFCNYDHVASSTPRLHQQFLTRTAVKREDKSNKLLNTEVQLEWLREIGFIDVDCYWKWLEYALMIGVKSGDIVT
ncbi:MAG: class I SAM-dependent methyltransferase [Nitrosopumilus sp.]|nr:class I SAM-dependent methyltransferase [Nitrosopumilus sp.]